jgi:hypothetical protein
MCIEEEKQNWAQQPFVAQGPNSKLAISIWAWLDESESSCSAQTYDPKRKLPKNSILLRLNFPEEITTIFFYIIF